MRVRGIRARFPLGVYSGHRPDGSPDILPSTLRLHAALVAAACTGSSAERRGNQLVRTAAATRALEWIEDNPPDFVELPPVRENSQVTEFSYRDEGLIEGAGRANRRKAPRAVGSGTALAAALGWGWQAIPDDVCDTLADLCHDVVCLGEADSPVILEFGEISPTHRRSARVSPFAPAGLRIATPVRGRLSELDELHSAAHPGKRPTAASDRWTKSEKIVRAKITHAMAVDIGYDAIHLAESAIAPWRHVIHIAIDISIGNTERVGWSVALHRAMVAALDTEASAVITGRYDSDATPPANRVAIQPLDSGVMALSRHAHLGPGIAVLVPDGALEITERALSKLTRLYRRGEDPIHLGPRTVVQASTFWRTPEAGMVRVWESLPAVVPETRRPRRSARRAWTLAESALLSLGFVFRDVLPPADAATAEARYSAMVDEVAAHGARVITTSPIPDADVHRYAHKLPQGLVAQPYRLQLFGGSLIPEQALIAIGQSRHLGGGLLCPVDRPESLVRSWSETP